MYIGKNKVKKQHKIEDNENLVGLEFEEGQAMVLHKDIVDSVLTEEEGDFPLFDTVCSSMAHIILDMLEEYGLSMGHVSGVTGHLTNLAQNDYEEATEKLWNGKYKQQVTIKEVRAILKEE